MNVISLSFFPQQTFYEGFCTRTVPYMSSYNMACKRNPSTKKHFSLSISSLFLSPPPSLPSPLGPPFSSLSLLLCPLAHLLVVIVPEQDLVKTTQTCRQATRT